MPDRESISRRNHDTPGMLHLYTLGQAVVVAFPGEVYDNAIDELHRTVLGLIERRSAKGLVIDLASLDLMDRFVANSVLDLARMASLLGADTVISGVRPEVASVLTNLGFATGSALFSSSVEQALEVVG